MGFRGEAFPVLLQYLRLQYSVQADNAGTRAEIEGGEFKSLESFLVLKEPESLSVILFYNTLGQKELFKKYSYRRQRSI